MSIALDTAVVSDYFEGMQASKTSAFNNAAGDFFIVRVRIWKCGGSQVHCSSVTYNGVAMTKAAEYLHDISGGCFTSNSIWYLAAPVTGNNDMVVTCDSSSYGGITTDANSWTGVKQTSPLDDSGSQDSSCIGISRTLTISANGDLAIGSISTGQTYSPSNGQTEDVADSGGYKLGIPSGSFTDSWTRDSNCGASDYVDAAFLQAVSGGNPTQAQLERFPSRGVYRGVAIR